LPNKKIVYFHYFNRHVVFSTEIQFSVSFRKFPIYGLFAFIELLFIDCDGDEEYEFCEFCEFCGYRGYRGGEESFSGHLGHLGHSGHFGIYLDIFLGG
jgi:hypothetical protein